MAIRRTTTWLAGLSAAALVPSACAADDAPAGGAASDTITVAVDREFTAYNDNTATGNGTWNTLVHNGVKANFWSYGADGSVVPNDEFGSYEKVSDDPLTIEYHINDETSWSDGVPIDCDDILLEWAAMSGAMTDRAGASLFSGASTNGYEHIVKPDCQPGDKDVTIVYSRPYVDWEQVILGGSVPAHIAAEQADLTSEQLVQAIAGDDVEALAPVARFWNTGWQFNPGELPDPALIPSSGPYVLHDWVAGQSLTLKANPAYYGTPPKTETIVLRVLDADQQVAALRNGEVDVISPGNPTVDMVDQLRALEGQVVTDVGPSLTWSHLDFQHRPGSPFERLQVRQAFAKCIPRQLIVDNLVVPADPDAVVQDLRQFFPSDPHYAQARQVAFPDEMYGEQDLDGARALLQQAGVPTPVDVRLMHGDDPVRNDLAALVRSECDKAGFNVVDFAPPDWGARLSTDPGSFDAVVFGWAGSGSFTAGQSQFVTNGDQNFYGYSNETVDRLWEEIVTTIDPERARALMMEMEAQLWEDVFNVPLYTNPNINAYAADIEGVQLNQAQSGVTFTMHEWSRAS